ncbi:ATP synthase F0 subunit B [Thermodesulfobacteriota bacterium]
MLEIDYSLWPPGTLWFQIANFLLLLYLLNTILFKPIRNILNKRKNEEDSLQEVIEDLQSKTGQYASDLEENVSAARREGFQEKENFKAEGLGEEKDVMNAANASAEDKITKAQEEIEDRMAQALESLRQEVDHFSRDLAERMLGRNL